MMPNLPFEFFFPYLYYYNLFIPVNIFITIAACDKEKENKPKFNHT